MSLDCTAIAIARASLVVVVGLSQTLLLGRQEWLVPAGLGSLTEHAGRECVEMEGESVKLAFASSFDVVSLFASYLCVARVE